MDTEVRLTKPAVLFVISTVMATTVSASLWQKLYVEQQQTGELRRQLAVSQ